MRRRPGYRMTCASGRTGLLARRGGGAGPSDRLRAEMKVPGAPWLQFTCTIRPRRLLCADRVFRAKRRVRVSYWYGTSTIQRSYSPA